MLDYSRRVNAGGFGVEEAPLHDGRVMVDLFGWVAGVTSEDPGRYWKCIMKCYMFSNPLLQLPGRSEVHVHVHEVHVHVLVRL